jgi:hypothetical protein
MKEETTRLGFGSERGELPPETKVYTCMNENCPKYNYPQKIEGLT